MTIGDLLVAAGLVAAGAMLWFLGLVARELYVYHRTEGVGVKDPSVGVDVVRELRRAALRELQIDAHRRRAQVKAITGPDRHE